MMTMGMVFTSTSYWLVYDMVTDRSIARITLSNDFDANTLADAVLDIDTVEKYLILTGLKSLPEDVNAKYFRNDIAKLLNSGCIL